MCYTGFCHPKSPLEIPGFLFPSLGFEIRFSDFVVFVVQGSLLWFGRFFVTKILLLGFKVYVTQGSPLGFVIFSSHCPCLVLEDFSSPMVPLKV